MINLLPFQLKREYRYASLNVHLLHWISAVVIALVGLGLIGSYGWLSLHKSISNSNQQISSLQTGLDQAHLTQVNKQVTDISSNFKLVVKVLGQEILFSKLIEQMATALPAGTNLTSLNIAGVTSGSGLDITAEATSYATATQVQVNLADPKNQLFAKADIVNISCDASAANNPTYPCSVTLRAQFAQKNPFLFINQTAVKS